jgi:hypothetical protein
MMYPKGYERVNPFLMYRFNHLSYPSFYYHPSYNVVEKTMSNTLKK